MVRIFLLTIVILSVVVCCIGQTFQYSRGWTNGKRSSGYLHEDSLYPDLVELDTEKKLDRCLNHLQRLIHNPFLLQHPSSKLSNNNNNNNNNGRQFNGGHHQSNEILDEISATEPIDFIKRQS